YAYAPHSGFCGERADDGGGLVAFVGVGVVGEEGGEESFAGGADEYAVAEAGEFDEAAEELPVVAAGFGEAEAGVDDDAAGFDAGDDEFGDAVFEFFAHGAHDVGVLGELLHGCGWAAPVHGDEVEATFGGDAAHAFVGESAGDVVDDGDAG